MYQYVREAFHIARYERRPVVLGVPYDLQKQPLPNIGDYKPSSDRHAADRAGTRRTRARSSGWSTRLAGAKWPIIIAGRGAMRVRRASEVEELAEAAGALLATTLLARGMFDHNPFSIGVAGGFAARHRARAVRARRTS